MTTHTTLTSKYRWTPRRAPVRVMPHERSAKATEAVVAGLNPEGDPRYQPEGGQTFCSTFLWDFTLAMYCEIPHWVDKHTGERRDPGAPGAIEINANAITADWMPTRGPVEGWRKESGLAAQVAADRGEVAVVLWLNRKGPHGHCSAIVPSRGEAGIWIAQAGAECFSRGRIERGFGSHVSEVQYWCHG